MEPNNQTSREEKVLLNATLCFPVKGDEILLGIKTKKIGQGCWNGYGGGIDNEETPEQSVLRELEEESKIKASESALEKVAIIDFQNTKTDGTVFICRVHVYLLHQWSGDFQATDEMASPTWFKKQELPLDKMMPADKEWLPIVLAGKKVIGKAKYGPFQETLLEKMELQYVDSFPDIH